MKRNEDQKVNIHTPLEMFKSGQLLFPGSTEAWRLDELASARSIAREFDNHELPAAPPVPTSSSCSRGDGVVAWQGSAQAPSQGNPRTENVEVLASHVGLRLKPVAWGGWWQTGWLSPKVSDSLSNAKKRCPSTA